MAIVTVIVVITGIRIAMVMVIGIAMEIAIIKIISQ